MIDTRTTVLRVNQSTLRREKDAWNEVVAPQDHHQPPPYPASVPRERLDPPRERPVDQLPDQSAPEDYWAVPRGVRPDVMELSDGSST